MREAFWRGTGAAIYLGDAREVLTEMPACAVDCVVTSPPFWGLRDYGPGQYGQEPTLDAYVENLVAVFDEVHRVLADDGTLWLNLGDRFAANSDGWERGERRNIRQPRTRPSASPEVRPKNLLGIPWRVALSLQSRGWLLRNAVVWSKPNAMPESAQDRLSCRYELIFLLAKRSRYWFNLDAVRVSYNGDRTLSRRARHGSNRPHSIQTPWPPSTSGTAPSNGMAMTGTAANVPPGPGSETPDGRNPGDVWSIPTRPQRHAHYAAFPIDIPLRCIAAGCRPGGTVADVFAGSGTTGLAALQLSRSFVGIDINADYCTLAAQRLEQLNHSDTIG